MMTKKTRIGWMSLLAVAVGSACFAVELRAQSGDTTAGRAPGSAVPVVPFTREVWLHALRQSPNIGDAAFGVTIEGIMYFSPRAADRWRRNVAAEVLAQPMTWVRAEIGYDPESALITGAGGFHLLAEGVAPVSTNVGAGAYVRFDRAGSSDAALVNDTEIGGQAAFWTRARRTFVNEKIGVRMISAGGDNIDDEGTFIQLRHYLVYVPSEDWTLTYVQKGTARIGFGTDPHTNEFRAENIFLWSPTLSLTFGPIVGVDFVYYYGTAASVLSIPTGARCEVRFGSLVLAGNATYDVPTIAGQRSAGLIVRGSAGFRF